ncbi:MAG: hypothetical protein AB7O66_20005, partial [Limisphaerales bacterium]
MLRLRLRCRWWGILGVVWGWRLGGGWGAVAKESEFRNVSYDPSRELCQEMNVAVARHGKASTGDTVTSRP